MVPGTVLEWGEFFTNGTASDLSSFLFTICFDAIHTHFTTSSGISPLVALANIKNPGDSLFVIDIVKNPVVPDLKTVLGRILINNERGFDLGFPGRARVIGQSFNGLHNLILNLRRDDLQGFVELLLNGFSRKPDAVFHLRDSLIWVNNRLTGTPSDPARIAFLPS
jgi:hypothetical protein